jgi:hypothetical protein
MASPLVVCNAVSGSAREDFSLTLARPDGLMPNDMLVAAIAVIYQDNATLTWGSAPTGFSQFGGTSATVKFPDPDLWIYDDRQPWTIVLKAYKYRLPFTPIETATSWTFTLGSGPTESESTTLGLMLVVRDADSTFATAGAGFAADAHDVSTANLDYEDNGGALAIDFRVGGIDDAGSALTWTAPSGWTKITAEASDYAAKSGWNNQYATLAAAWKHFLSGSTVPADDWTTTSGARSGDYCTTYTFGPYPNNIFVGFVG